MTDVARVPGRSTLTCATPCASQTRLTESGSVAPATTRYSIRYEISVRTVSSSSEGSRSVLTTIGYQWRSRASRSNACDMPLKKRLSCIGMIMPIRPERLLRSPLACRFIEYRCAAARRSTFFAVVSAMRRAFQFPLSTALTVDADTPASAARS